MVGHQIGEDRIFPLIVFKYHYSFTHDLFFNSENGGFLAAQIFQAVFSLPILTLVLLIGANLWNITASMVPNGPVLITRFSCVNFCNGRMTLPLSGKAPITAIIHVTEMGCRNTVNLMPLAVCSLTA